MSTNIKNMVPMILGPILFILILVLTFFRLRDGGIWDGWIFNMDIVFVCAYLLWIILESRVSKSELDKGDKTRDFGTCGLYAIGQAAVFLSALWFEPVWRSPGPFHILGFSIFLIGVSFRLWAIRTLGRYYSHIVREVDDHRIIDSGPYRYIRHPAYSGMITANLGVVIYFFNLPTLIIFLCLFMPAIVLRILVEEKILFNMEGYPEFARKRKRLFPAVW